MSRRKIERKCFACGADGFENGTALAIHTSRDCPGNPDPGITRPVACWSCAGEIDLRQGNVCPSCGRVYAGPGIIQRTET